MWEAYGPVISLQVCKKKCLCHELCFTFHFHVLHGHRNVDPYTLVEVGGGGEHVCVCCMGFRETLQNSWASLNKACKSPALWRKKKKVMIHKLKSSIITSMMTMATPKSIAGDNHAWTCCSTAQEYWGGIEYLSTRKQTNTLTHTHPNHHHHQG